MHPCVHGSLMGRIACEQGLHANLTSEGWVRQFGPMLRFMMLPEQPSESARQQIVILALALLQHRWDSGIVGAGSLAHAFKPEELSRFDSAHAGACACLNNTDIALRAARVPQTFQSRSTLRVAANELLLCRLLKSTAPFMLT